MPSIMIAMAEGVSWSQNQTCSLYYDKNDGTGYAYTISWESRRGRSVR